ncbi:MAG: Stf0 family sulfotransferase, partial [Paracoccaceae bacterium]
GAAQFLKFWPNLTVVHLCRADVLRQAISYAVARQTGVWITGQEAEQNSADYDPKLIAEGLDDIALQNAGWNSAFAAAGITPLSLRYEDVQENIAAAVADVARHAGVTGSEDIPDVTQATTRQGNAARTEDWINRYAAERRRAVSGGGRGLGRLARLVRSR